MCTSPNKVSDGWREKVKSTCREEDDKDVKEDDKDMEENTNSEDSQVDNKVISEVCVLSSPCECLIWMSMASGSL